MVYGDNGEIILFDPVHKSFEKKVNIDKVGSFPSCIAINNEIHIIGGRENNGKHLIYSATSNTIKCIDCKTSKSKICMDRNTK